MPSSPRLSGIPSLPRRRYARPLSKAPCPSAPGRIDTLRMRESTVGLRAAYSSGTSKLASAILTHDLQAELNERPHLCRAVQPRGIDRVKGKAFVRPFGEELNQLATVQKLPAADFQNLADACAGLAGADQRSRVRHHEARLHPQRQHFFFSSHLPVVRPRIGRIVEVDAISLLHLF